jgi:integrase
MSIRKRELPSGEIRWLCDYRDGGGVRRNKQFRTQKEAKAFADDTSVAIRAGLHVPDTESVTVAKAGELWLERCRLEELEPGTLRFYKQHLDLRILPAIGGVKLNKLTKPAVEAFRDKLLKDCSKSMAAKVMISLRSLLFDAQRRGLVGQNVAQGSKVKLAGRHEQRANIPTKDEIRALLAKTSELWRPNEPWRALIAVALFSGLRASELRGLSWDCVNLDAKTVEVRRRADFRGVLGSPKSKAGRRTVPLASYAVNVLKAWRLACPQSELVFPSARGGVIVISEVHRQWNALLEAAGLPRLRYRFHDLRHAFASLMIDQGWSSKKIQVVMGHANIATTMDIYGHLWSEPESDAAAMEQVAERLLRPV